MLSDEECREIWRTALARCHPTNDISVAGVFAARAAYALGVERARKVKPLVWRRSDNRDGGFALFCKRYAVTNYKLDKGLIYYETEPFKRQSAESVDEAIAACQKHHDELVLSQLEQP